MVLLLPPEHSQLSRDGFAKSWLTGGDANSGQDALAGGSGWVPDHWLARRLTQLPQVFGWKCVESVSSVPLTRGYICACRGVQPVGLGALLSIVGGTTAGSCRTRASGAQSRWNTFLHTAASSPSRATLSSGAAALVAHAMPLQASCPSAPSTTTNTMSPTEVGVVRHNGQKPIQ